MRKSQWTNDISTINMVVMYKKLLKRAVFADGRRRIPKP